MSAFTSYVAQLKKKNIIGSQEYHKDPSSIGGRRYTSFARWKFREFNELPHVFKRRLDESYPIASMYIGQFPNEKITIVMRFVSFLCFILTGSDCV
jgi:hypothetical protein